MKADQETPRITAEMVDQLRSWQGRRETLADDITEWPVRAMPAMVDRAEGYPVKGSELPRLWHWLYFLPCALQCALGEDGHPRRGDFLPPVPLPRRMWAGGRLEWHGPLRIDDSLQRVSHIESVTHKAGSTGELVFVVVRHEVFSEGKLALTDKQDIVYRAASRRGDSPPLPQPAPLHAEWARNITPDPVLLFRYSALTFNGHRIHYDRSYVTEVEGYSGLIVHGPLIATLLADLGRSQRPEARVSRFNSMFATPTLG